MKVITKQPDENAQVTELEGGLSSLQHVVGGYIEAIDFINDSVLICNEEGKLNGLPVNFIFGNDFIVGPVIICGTSDEEFTSLSEDQIKCIMRHLND